MEDRAFLRYALEQSFYRPIVNSAEGLSVQTEHCRDFGCIFRDIRHNGLTEYVLPAVQIKKCLKCVDYDTRHAYGLYAEYDLYKHDVRENIIIPEDFAPIAEARRRFDLLTVNRQSAQKKRICARIIPAIFSDKLREIQPQYLQTMQNIELLLSKNPDAVNISVLNDFAAVYRQIMRLCRPNHPALWLNKKRLNYHINEAAQILKSLYPLPEDFIETRKFTGENSRWMRKAAGLCKEKLSVMLSLLQQMKSEPHLLTLVQTLLADTQKYTAELAAYRNAKKISDVSQISAVRHNAQKLFENYAFLNYLDGVRFVFENRYLNECPEPRQPALPTVSPVEELKKVERIVEESKKLDASSGKIGSIYISALKNYIQTQRVLDKILAAQSAQNAA